MNLHCDWNVLFHLKRVDLTALSQGRTKNIVTIGISIHLDSAKIEAGVKHSSAHASSLHEHIHAAFNMLFEGNERLMQAIVATVAIFTKSSSFTFTKRESTKMLWAGNKIEEESLFSAQLRIGFCYSLWR